MTNLTEQRAPPKNRGLHEAWRIQRQTIYALMVRDLMMRYGRENLGFAWAILEPMILTCGVMGIWTVMGGHAKEGIKVVELVLTGYMPLTLWRHLTGPVVNMFRGNVAMLYHRQVTLLDLVMARQILEIAGTTAALIIIYTTVELFGLIEGGRDFGMMVLGWMMMAWIGTSSGMLLAAFTERHEVAERFVQPIQYLNIPISGAFYLVDWLPDWGQKIIMWHPLVHCWEVFRAGYFGATIVSHYELGYFTACAFAMTFFGLRAIQRIRPHVRLQ